MYLYEYQFINKEGELSEVDTLLAGSFEGATRQALSALDPHGIYTDIHFIKKLF